MQYKVLKKNREQIHYALNKVIKKRNILLVEGTHSIENISYKNHPNNPVRGIDSIKKLLSGWN